MIGGLWVSFITQMGLFPFVNTLGAILAWILSGYIAVGSVWPGILIFGLDSFFANLGGGGGYATIFVASLGALIHLGISRI